MSPQLLPTASALAVARELNGWLLAAGMLERPGPRACTLAWPRGALAAQRADELDARFGIVGGRHALVVGALSDLGGCMDHVWAELSLPASRTPALPAAPSPDPKVPATATEHLDA